MEVSEIIDEIYGIIGSAEDDSFSVNDVVWYSYFEPIYNLVGKLEKEVC